MSNGELYAKLIEKALQDQDIAYDLSSGDKDRIHQGIAKALGPEEATPERVAAVHVLTHDEWQNISDAAKAFGRNKSINN